ncbi:hypothetical protein TNCV_2565021 [Trichonephila clavipes]|uniref:Uncharacterized protein n=1 Tax=Trichonephila clavipes TaxID=2585209 RepID=A0A8X6VF93_TRICX|nr:hypothetical protein TNCV_2565021 [Trichonephila clavipes]
MYQVQNRFAEHQPDFQHHSWTPQKPYLNLIENVRNRLERRIQQCSSHPSSLQDLKSCVAIACLQKCLQNTPKACRPDAQKRIIGVIRSKDGPIKYISYVFNSFASVCINLSEVYNEWSSSKLLQRGGNSKNA